MMKKIEDYIRQERHPIERLFYRMPMNEFLTGLRKDVRFHTNIDFTNEELKESLVNVVFDGVEPEFRDDISHKQWEEF